MVPKIEKCYIEEFGVPQTAEDLARLKKFVVVPDDFSENWIRDSYELTLGYYIPPTPNLSPYQQSITVRICNDEGQAYANKIDQSPYCLAQIIDEYESKETARLTFEKLHLGLANEPLETSDQFLFVKKVNSLSIICGVSDPDVLNFFYEPYNGCTVIMQHDRYLLWTRVLFDVSEEFVSYEEVGEIFNLIQDRFLAESQN